MDFSDIEICSYQAPQAAKSRRRSVRLKRLSVGSLSETEGDPLPVSVPQDEHLGSIWTDSPDIPVMKVKRRKSSVPFSISSENLEGDKPSRADTAFCSSPELSRTCTKSPANASGFADLDCSMASFPSFDLDAASRRIHGSLSPCYDEGPPGRQVSRRSSGSLSSSQCTPLTLAVRSSADSTPYSSRRQRTRLSCGDMPYSPSQPISCDLISPLPYSPSESSESVYTTPIDTPLSLSPTLKTPASSVEEPEEWFTCRKAKPMEKEEVTPKLEPSRKFKLKREIIQRNSDFQGTGVRMPESEHKCSDTAASKSKAVEESVSEPNKSRKRNHAKVTGQSDKSVSINGKLLRQSVSSRSSTTSFKEGMSIHKTSSSEICQNLFKKHMRQKRHTKKQTSGDSEKEVEDQVELHPVTSELQADRVSHLPCSKPSLSSEDLYDVVGFETNINIPEVSMEDDTCTSNTSQSFVTLVSEAISEQAETSSSCLKLEVVETDQNFELEKECSNSDVVPNPKISDLTREQLGELDSYLGLSSEKLQKQQKKPRGRPRSCSTKRKKIEDSFEIFVEANEKVAENSDVNPAPRDIRNSVVDNEEQNSPDISQVVDSICEDMEMTRMTRRSQRNKRRSIELYKKGNTTGEECGTNSPLNISEDHNGDGIMSGLTDVTNQITGDQSENNNLVPQKPGRKRKSQPEVPLEDIYRNKNFKMPEEKLWETIYEESFPSQEVASTSSQLFGKRRMRRSICFESVAPSKVKKRIQKAVKMGWDPRRRKRKLLSDADVLNKIAEIEQQLQDI